MTPKYDRPAADEYAPYYGTYINKVPAGDLLTILAEQIPEAMNLLRPLSDDKAMFAYAPGKWTIKQCVGHLFDSERVFAYRIVSFARADPTPLPSFDENLWIEPGQFNARSLTSLVDEWVAVRSASLALLSGLPVEARTRRGIASGKEVSVRALAHILAGHVTHHLQVLRERYL